MRLTAFILFSGIALTSLSACASGPGDTATAQQASLTPCPWQQGYPDCHADDASPFHGYLVARR